MSWGSFKMKSLLNAVLAIVTFSILTGLIYPAAVTAIAVICFSSQSRGSLTYHNGHIIGSRLIGQNFSAARYFRPRPSATNYDAMPSGGSNLPPISDSLRALVKSRREAFRSVNGLDTGARVPNDMLFASGSGLDPDISPEAARLQICRIVRQRNFTPAQQRALSALVERSIVPPQLGFLGEARVNVLRLNQDLDQLERGKEVHGK